MLKKVRVSIGRSCVGLVDRFVGLRRPCVSLRGPRVDLT